MFLHLQKTLRDLDSHHAIDLSLPHGVSIEGRHYPALNKHIDFGGDEEEKRNYDATFDIPIENGTRLHVMAGKYENDYGDREESQHSQLLVPTIHFNHEGVKSYHYGPAYHVGDDAYWQSHKSGSPYNPITSIHEAIREYSRLPQQGTFDWADQGGYKAFSEARPNHTHWAFGVEGRDLNEDDLAEHRQNYKINPLHGPLHINTERWLPGIDKKFKYRYNIGTEQMHLIDGED